MGAVGASEQGTAGGRRWRTRGDVLGKRQESGPPGPRSASARARPAEASLGTRRPELLCRTTVLRVRRGQTSGSHGADPHPGRRPVSLRCSCAGPVLRSTASGASSACAPPVLECQPTKRQLRCKRSPAPPNLIRISSSPGHLQHFLFMMKFNPFHHISGLFDPKLSPFPVDY